MNDFLRTAYGDPCRGCGYDWSVEPVACAAIVGNAPARFSALLAGQDGQKACASLQWNAVAYVMHVVDVLRIWADRVAAAALGSSDPIVSYDEGRLGDVRGYGGLPLVGALWSLERAVGDWRAAEELGRPARMVLNHPAQGSLTLDEVQRIMGHEIEHHVADLMLIVSA